MTAFVLVRLMTAGALLAAAAGPALAQAPKPWKHGIIAPKADAGFLLMAAKRGFAEKEGLKLELLEVKDDQIGLKALLSGELDSYEGGVQGAIAVNVRGGDVKIMGCHWVVVPHGIMVKAGIDKIEDLKGKAVAVSAPGSFPDMLARLALAKFKIAPSEVTLAAVGGDRDRYTALVGGVVAAAVVSNEYLPLESSKGLKMLLEGKDALPNFVRICMFSTSKVLAERREDAIRYLTAQSKALRYALAHRDETDALAVEATAAKPGDPRPASCSTTPSRSARSRPICRCPWTSSPGCRSRWSRSARSRRPAISPRWSIPTSAHRRWNAPANRSAGARASRQNNSRSSKGANE